MDAIHSFMLDSSAVSSKRSQQESVAAETAKSDTAEEPGTIVLLFAVIIFTSSNMLPMSTKRFCQ